MRPPDELVCCRDSSSEASGCQVPLEGAGGCIGHAKSLGARAPEFPVSHNALPVTFEHEELLGSIPSSGSSFDLSGK